MAKEEVLSLLGRPTITVGPAKVNVTGDVDSEAATAAAAGIGDALLGGYDEYWAYCPIWKAFDSLFGAPDEAFVVYFDSNGRVTSCRGPQAGPYAGQCSDVIGVRVTEPYSANTEQP